MFYLNSKTSTKFRHNQSWMDFVKFRIGTPQPGGYPIDTTETQAYYSGFARGYYAAFRAAINLNRCPDVNADDTDGTSACCGEQDGWNDAVKKLK